MARQRKHPIKSIAAVERALLVLDAFRTSGKATLGLSEIVACTGLLKTTVFRILLTFENMGYLTRMSDGRYQLGAVCMQLGVIYQGAFQLEEHVASALQHLSDLTLESASFFVRENESRLLRLRVDSPQSLRDVNAVGTILPLDGTATSRVLTDFYAQLWSQQQPVSQEMLRATRNHGNTETSSISAPVFGPEGLLGAITLSGPTSRFHAEAVTSFSHHLLQTATDLSIRFCGGRPRSVA